MRYWTKLLIVVAVSGCFAPKVPPVIEHVVPLSVPGKIALQFRSTDGETIGAVGETIDFQAGHLFKIAGEIETSCEVGDSVFLTMELPLPDGKWTSCCGSAAPKIVSVKAGRGQFSTDFYLTESSSNPELKCRLKIEILRKNGGDRRPVAEIEGRIHTKH